MDTAKMECMAAWSVTSRDDLRVLYRLHSMDASSGSIGAKWVDSRLLKRDRPGLCIQWL